MTITIKPLAIALTALVVILVCSARCPASQDDRENHQDAHPAPAGGHTASGPPIRGELGFWSIIVFAGLLFVLGKFAWKPLIEALDTREKNVRDSLLEAEQARIQAKALLAEHAKKLAEAQSEVRAILDDARRDAQQTQQEILKQAQVEAQAARERATREIEQARDRALQEIFARTADLATEVAGRIVRRTLNPQDHRDLVQQVLTELPSKN